MTSPQSSAPTGRQMQDHAKIVAALRGGDRASALADIERLLAAEPGNSELLGLKGLAMAVGGKLDEAAECARLAVLHATTPAQRIKHAGTLARLLARSERYQDISALPDMDLPKLDSLAGDDVDSIDLENLCAPLLMAGNHDFVAAAASCKDSKRPMSISSRAAWRTYPGGLVSMHSRPSSLRSCARH